MTNIKGYLVERDNRSLFIRDINEASWALEDGDYLVTPLVPLKATDVYERLSLPHQPSPTNDDTQERLELLEQIYELEEEQIAQMKAKLEEFVELAEAIIEIAHPTENLIENKAKLLLIHESCKKLLAPSE